MARKPKTPKPEPHGNLTADTFQEHVDNIMALTAKKDSAVAALRTAHKQAQEVGINTRILSKALAIKKQDQHSAHGDYNDLAQYLRWLGTPIGQQLELLPEPAFEEDRPHAPGDENSAEAVH